VKHYDHGNGSIDDEAGGGDDDDENAVEIAAQTAFS